MSISPVYLQLWTNERRRRRSSQLLVLGKKRSWFLVLGSWFLVLGSWFLVLGSWCGVRKLAWGVERGAWLSALAVYRQFLRELRVLRGEKCDLIYCDSKNCNILASGRNSGCRFGTNRPTMNSVVRNAI